MEYHAKEVKEMTVKASKANVKDTHPILGGIESDNSVSTGRVRVNRRVGNYSTIILTEYFVTPNITCHSEEEEGPCAIHSLADVSGRANSDVPKEVSRLEITSALATHANNEAGIS